MKYRVLVVDDSVVMRRIVRQSLESDPEIEVVGVAANGRIALAMVEQYTLDAITLDIEMPEMDGLQTLRELRARGVHTPVDHVQHPDRARSSGHPGRACCRRRRLCCKTRERGQRAGQHVANPSGSDTQDQSALLEVAGISLASRCDLRKPASRHSFPIPEAPAAVSAAASAHFPRPQIRRVDIVAIGTSTGGPNALAEVIPHLPANFPVPIVIVQHMPPTFTRFLAERLTAASSLLVREGVSGALLEPGAAWIAPGDFHMNLRRDDTSVRLGDLSGAAGKLLPAFCRCAVSLRGGGIRGERAGRGHDRHGAGRAARL